MENYVDYYNIQSYNTSIEGVNQNKVTVVVLVYISYLISYPFLHACTNLADVDLQCKKMLL